MATNTAIVGSCRYRPAVPQTLRAHKCLPSRVSNTRLDTSFYTALSLISFHYRTWPGSASEGGYCSYIAKYSVRQERHQC